MAIQLNISDITDNVSVSSDGLYEVTGDGVFDRLMETINTNVRAQFDAGRIKGSDYATVYLGAMQGALQASLQYALTEQKTENEIEEMLAAGAKDRDIKERTMALAENKQADDFLTTAKQREQITAQKALYERQTEGFDDNKNQKLFEAQMNTWGLMYSSGILETAPSIINNDEVSALYTAMTT